MTLTLYYHPLASFCWKSLIALYETGAHFEPAIVDFGDEKSAAEFKAVWPMAKMPALVDDARGVTTAESIIVSEYVATHYPGSVRLLPDDADTLLRMRIWDRVFDNYVHLPMQNIVADVLRPEASRDPFGVQQWESNLRAAYDYLEGELPEAGWMMGEDFTLADCAAAPALFYAELIIPFQPSHKRVASYLERLCRRPSFARVLREAEPYFAMYPRSNKPRIKYPV